MIFAHNTGGLDNSHACALDSGLACYPNVGPGILTVGTWTKLEAYMSRQAPRRPHGMALSVGGSMVSLLAITPIMNYGWQGLERVGVVGNVGWMGESTAHC